MMKNITVDCCRHCQFVEYLEPVCWTDGSKWRPYCTNSKTDGRDINDVDIIPDWCALEDTIRPKQDIEERLNRLHRDYRGVSSDNIDMELEAQIRELKWVLEGDESYISHEE